MVEKVRLVVWDLDETFWQGTLTEGGMQYLRAHHDIVVELARRGIVSSICSKNDFDRVREILKAEGIWDYFIFPSINWEPKGPRLQALVETVQLRAPTVLFIDDNHANLREAEFFIPEMQVSDQTIIPHLLADPRCKGKDDSALTRLAQYKLLEKRKEDEAAAAASGGSNVEFLRSSDIRVQIDPDIEANLDRAIELINRTNQLNYTKRRLPEDLEHAREELRATLSEFRVQAGLVRVSDRYGDHGYCGFYMTLTSARGATLRHFCFSCRILNMGVETWLYQRLGRPYLQVVGEVLTPIARDAAPVDWITLSAPSGSAAMPDVAARVGRLVVRGGCDLMAVAHYFTPIVREVVGEFNYIRDGVMIRSDHSQFLHYALHGLTAAERTLLPRLGYTDADASTRLFDDYAGEQIWLLSFWVDLLHAVYRHNETGLMLPLAVPFPLPSLGGGDKTKLTEDLIPEEYRTHWIADVLKLLREEFTYVPQTPAETLERTIHETLARAPSGVMGFVMLANEQKRTPSGTIRVLDDAVAMNAVTRSVVARFPAFEAVDIRQFLHDEAEVDPKNPFHFDRRVYHRLFEYIAGKIAARASDQGGAVTTIEAIAAE